MCPAEHCQSVSQPPPSSNIWVLSHRESRALLHEPGASGRSSRRPPGGRCRLKDGGGRAGLLGDLPVVAGAAQGDGDGRQVPQAVRRALHAAVRARAHGLGDWLAEAGSVVRWRVCDPEGSPLEGEEREGL